MLGFIPISRVFLCAVFLLALPLAAYSKDLYRYINTDGNIVLDDHIPPEYATGGYEVLNEEGVVTKVVPRVLTGEELARRMTNQQLAADIEAEKDRLRIWDETLLLRYSSIADIEAARERALRDLRIRLSILRSNAHSLKQQVENNQAVAADIERSGGTVNVQRLTAIEEKQSEIALTEHAIAERMTEIDRVKQGFQRDIDRFETLLELVELRNTPQTTNR